MPPAGTSCFMRTGRLRGISSPVLRSSAHGHAPQRMVTLLQTSRAARECPRERGPEREDSQSCWTPAVPSSHHSLALQLLPAVLFTPKEPTAHSS